MSRRTERAAEEAARAASEAARTLQARGQEAKAERAVEAAPESQDKPAAVEMDPSRRERLAANRPHERAMDDLIASRGLDKEPEVPKAEKPAEKPQEAPAEAPVAEAPAKPEAAPEAPAAAPEQPAKPEIKTIRVKVDGEEFDAPAEDVEAYGGLRAYQIAKAGENRLKKADSFAAQQKQMLEQMTQLLQQHAKPPVPTVTDQQFIAERMDKLRFGTPEEAAQAQMEILQRANKQIDPSQIIEAATQRMAWNGAVQQFKTEFQDITSNPVLMAAADALDRQKRGQGQVVDWINHFRTIGNEVRSAFGRSSQPATPSKDGGTTSQTSEKEARKASITVIPTAAARAELPKEEKEPTPEEARKQAIADMRKSRGQIG